MDTFSRYCFNLYFGDGGDMTFKQLKKQNKELQERLNLANDTVSALMKEVGSLQRILASKQLHLEKSLNDIEEHYENQLKVQDNELKRRLTIIHYLETKCMKGFED